MNYANASSRLEPLYNLSSIVESNTFLDKNLELNTCILTILKRQIFGRKHMMDDRCLELGTNEIIEALIARRLGIEEELARLEKDLKRAPEGRLRL